MNKTVIIYASSHGTTVKAATLLCKELSGHVSLVDLNNTRLPDITEFDAVILGGSIHVGTIQRKVTKFIKHSEQQLLKKKVGLFLCCMYEGEQAQAQFEQAFSEDLRNQSVANGLFGGEFLFGKMNFLEKAIIKKMKGDAEDVSTLNHEAISQFAQQFQAR
ncbi:flavodoxin domain-containing protein [Anaerobacillus sp. CMMVII]|uniref:flavodoxin domain-containing protein n=1 Tax=Anaerobacillus sp. CMMVII TaxID=2755588 RepID=UPI0021B79A4E|nr:flavodoxin domain-containing protein [Anaerobacillus sp. CMMVII]MCT8138117.1 flavodoxin domain-containing protein [Anaerobacillus sp. CMMVII]